jgi:serine/threonine protein kinase
LVCHHQWSGNTLSVDASVPVPPATSLLATIQTADGNQVALKMVTEAHRDEMEREHRIIRKLRTSVQINEGQDTSIFLRSLPDMELLVWRDNGKELKAGAVKPLGTPLRRPLGRYGLECILRTLCVAHHAGYVHRDIRPPNLIVDDTNNSQIVLIDFGFAAEVGKDTRYAGAPYLKPVEATDAELVGVDGSYKPWPMHDLAQLLQILAYHADVLTEGGYQAVPADRRDAEGMNRVRQPENVLLTAVARLVAAAAEMPAELPSDVAQGGLGALIRIALKAARGESAVPSTQTVSTDMDDAGAQGLYDMVLSSINSAKEAFQLFPNLAHLASAHEDQQQIFNCIKHRPQRTLAGRWAWYQALHAVLASTTICKTQAAFLDGDTIARLDTR